jgi:hypothetical protein
VAARFTISPFEYFVLPTRTRFPFRYGIASMTDVPHVFLRTRVSAGGRSMFGLGTEGLPPKWFTKNPETTFEQDLPAMLEVISRAAGVAEQIAARPVTFFDFWRELYRQQSLWAESAGVVPLLANLGVSLVERAVLDGLCRVAGRPLHHMVASNDLAIRLGDIHPDLGAAAPRDLLPAAPLDRCFVRYTVGLGDPLTPADIRADERVDDGLPQDLETSIRAYGLRYFKVKLSGVPERDVPRLEQLAQVLERATGGEFLVTIDGNENFAGMGEFRLFWESTSSRASLRGLWRRVLAVEQPVHRDRAMNAAAAADLAAWPERPPLIVDESEGGIGDLTRALAAGYAGTSHKNCKGIVKGIANACLLAKRRADGRPGVLTGEDLCNLGPIALLQDLAMTAMFGIGHVERNGHHYYRGLSMLPPDWQESAMSAHPDLYVLHPDGFACLHVHEGGLQLGSVNRAPFGVDPLLDVARFARLDMAHPGRISWADTTTSAADPAAGPQLA